MSRVFEALARSSGERSESVGEIGSGQLGVNGKILGKDDVKFDRKAGQQPLEPLLSHLHPSAKSWHYRLEEILFGWGLRRYRTHPLVALERRSPAADHYKILRENLKRVCTDKGSRFLSVTSPVKQDGKSLVSANLATALALGGESKVLLIDSDLHSPQIHRYFGLHPNPGLADYLSSSAEEDLSKYVQSTFLPNLQVLPAGKPRDLSSELLSRLESQNIIEAIRSKFPDHQVIIDTLPLLSAPDALVLVKVVEGVIMVIRAGKTSRNQLLEAVRYLESNKLIGIVLNQA